MATITKGFLTSTINGIKINSSLPCHSSNYNNKSSRDVKYVVIHYTGNSKDNSINNSKYFQGANRNASAHFFVGETDICQSVELRDIAWHCGGSKGYRGECTNSNSFGIEMTTCGNYLVSLQTQINSAYLCAELCKIIGIDENKVDTYVLRHNDTTYNYKKCPAQFVSDPSQWARFKTWVKNILTTGSHEISSSSTTSTKVNVTYAVKIEGGKVLPEVKNLDDYAGIENKKITDIAMKVDKGSIKYQVHVLGGGWLDWVTGYNWKDHKNGYAGNGKPIDAIRVYYSTPSDLTKNGDYREAKYHVSPVGSTSYYEWQLDDTVKKSKNMNGYSGTFGKAIDKVQICIE